MKKINWEKVLEYTAKTVFVIIAAGITGWAFFMLGNMFYALVRNW